MSDSSEPIVCRVTPWYHKRRIAMLVLVFGFAVAFFYDWQVRYPRNRDAAAAMLQLKKDGKEADYAALAAEKGWPEKIEETKDWDYAIKEQLVCGILALTGGLVMLFYYVRTVRGTLSADAVSFTTPVGQHVPFSAAFRIDRRKWDHKGLAYVFYRDAKGAEKRAVIDDLIFGGAAQVLDRLSANFQGEVIDLEKKEEEQKASEPAQESVATGDSAAG
jgi:hypothetical protein